MVWVGSVGLGMGLTVFFRFGLVRFDLVWFYSVGCVGCRRIVMSYCLLPASRPCLFYLFLSSLVLALTSFGLGSFRPEWFEQMRVDSHKQRRK